MRSLTYAVLTALLFSWTGEAASLKSAFGRLSSKNRKAQASAAVTLRKKRQFTSGRHTLGYLVAVQEWKAASSRGLQCPPPDPCECHCDCPLTNFEKPPPPPEPCPVHQQFPTTPPPPPRPIAQTTPAPLGRNQVNVPGFNKPITFTNECAIGEVTYSNGECVRVTMDMINQLISLCAGLKSNLDLVEHHAEVNGPGEYVFNRFEVMTANERYRRALDLLISVLDSFVEDSTAQVTEEEEESEEQSDKDKGNITGPEFIHGEVVHRVHCEPWSKNATYYTHSLGEVSINTCGVICRSQPTCVGFSVEPTYGWCVWYDDKVEPPFAEQQCSSHNMTQYLKMWEGPQNTTLWLAMEKAHAYERKWRSLLFKADTEAEIANRTFQDFWTETNMTQRNQTMHMLLDAKANYTATLAEAESVKDAYFGESITAYNLVRGEVVAHPPFLDPSAFLPAEAEDEPKGLQPIQAYTTDLLPSPTPVPLKWADFPNSQDTEWSQQHPECPMGPPCWCNCECRGAPPQNFIPNPPPPPQPCPPPPLPPLPIVGEVPLLR